MNKEAQETEALLDKASRGDLPARWTLLERYRERLCRMVAVRMDPRLSRRQDSSDIVQESLADAASKLDVYLTQRPLPFYPWLHRLTLERLAEAHRRHVVSLKRCVDRELQVGGEASSSRLAELFTANDTTPSGHLLREERRLQVLSALGELPASDREVLVMRYLEGLAFREIAEILVQKESAVKVRHFRALRKVRDRLEQWESEPGR